MFRASPAHIIRSTQTVVTATDTTTHGHVRSEVAAQPWTHFKWTVSLHLQFMTCTSGCNYSLFVPDDGCGRRPKHVE